MCILLVKSGDLVVNAWLDCNATFVKQIKWILMSFIYQREFVVLFNARHTNNQQLLKRKKIFLKIISSKAYHSAQGTHQHTLRNNYRAQEIKWHNKNEAEIKTLCSIKTWLRLLWFFISMWFFLRRSFVFHLKSLKLVFAYVQFTLI